MSFLLLTVSSLTTTMFNTCTSEVQKQCALHKTRLATALASSRCLTSIRRKVSIAGTLSPFPGGGFGVAATDSPGSPESALPPPGHVADVDAFRCRARAVGSRLLPVVALPPPLLSDRSFAGGATMGSGYRRILPLSMVTTASRSSPRTSTRRRKETSPRLVRPTCGSGVRAG